MDLRNPVVPAPTWPTPPREARAKVWAAHEAGRLRLCAAPVNLINEKVAN
jgi:hypothetical protein